MVDVAQLVRAPVCGTGGRGFKSRHPPHIKPPRGNAGGFLLCTFSLNLFTLKFVLF